MLQLTAAETAADIATVRALFRAYQSELNIDLCFQDFDAELQSLPGDYAPPGGALTLARNDDEAVGCVALRVVDGQRCEMKRLYVQPSARGLGIGRTLIAHALETARAKGYKEVVLDTLPSMREAQALYEQYGFRDIPPYRLNPVLGARYLGRLLQADTR